MADALSRNPVNVAQVLTFQSVRSPDPEPSCTVENDTSTSPGDTGDMEVDIQHLQHQDPELVQIISYLEDSHLPEDN